MRPRRSTLLLNSKSSYHYNKVTTNYSLENFNKGTHQPDIRLIACNIKEVNIKVHNVY